MDEFIHSIHSCLWTHRNVIKQIKRVKRKIPNTIKSVFSFSLFLFRSPSCAMYRNGMDDKTQRAEKWKKQNRFVCVRKVFKSKTAPNGWNKTGIISIRNIQTNTIRSKERKNYKSKTKSTIEMAFFAHFFVFRKFWVRLEVLCVADSYKHSKKSMACYKDTKRLIL